GFQPKHRTLQVEVTANIKGAGDRFDCSAGDGVDELRKSHRVPHENEVQGDRGKKGIRCLAKRSVPPVYLSIRSYQPACCPYSVNIDPTGKKSALVFFRNPRPFVYGSVNWDHTLFCRRADCRCCGDCELSCVAHASLHNPAAFNARCFPRPTRDNYNLYDVSVCFGAEPDRMDLRDEQSAAVYPQQGY